MNDTELEQLRHKIALQIVKARVPGYKRTKGDWNDEAYLLPSVYVDNILALIKQRETRLVAEARIDERRYSTEQLEDEYKDLRKMDYFTPEFKEGYYRAIVDSRLNNKDRLATLKQESEK